MRGGGIRPRRSRSAAVTPDDLLTVIYTLGTDGPPTLVRLTHADVLARVTELGERLALGDGWRAISWQPMADIAERLCTHYPADCPRMACHHMRGSGCGRVSCFRRFDRSSSGRHLRCGRGCGIRCSRASTETRSALRADRAAAIAAIGLEQVRIAIVAASCPPDIVGFWRALGVPLNIEELRSQ